jgi:hypothetical protein
MGSLSASFPLSVTLLQLRFASIQMASFRQDLHLQDNLHAGRTRSPPQAALLRTKFTVLWSEIMGFSELKE